MTDMPDCVICGTNLHRNWVWTDYHGEFECRNCGMIYDMAGYRDKIETKCRIAEEAISIYKEYWDETKCSMSLGFYMGQTAVQRSHIIAFNDWIEKKHPELLTQEKKEE